MGSILPTRGEEPGEMGVSTMGRILGGPDYANKVFMDILKNIDPKLQSALTEKKKQEQGSVEPSSGQEKRR